MVSSPAATEKAGAMGREIESRQGICRVVAFRRKNCSLPELSEQSLTLDGGLSPSTDGEVDLNGGRLKKNESSELSFRRSDLDFREVVMAFQKDIQLCALLRGSPFFVKAFILHTHQKM
jgi:hypothetical protein